MREEITKKLNEKCKHIGCSFCGKNAYDLLDDTILPISGEPKGYTVHTLMCKNCGLMHTFSISVLMDDKPVEELPLEIPENVEVITQQCEV